MKFLDPLALLQLCLEGTDGLLPAYTLERWVCVHLAYRQRMKTSNVSAFLGAGYPVCTTSKTSRDLMTDWSESPPCFPARCRETRSITITQHVQSGRQSITLTPPALSGETCVSSLRHCIAAAAATATSSSNLTSYACRQVVVCCYCYETRVSQQIISV